MTTNNILLNISDPDNILLKSPTPVLIVKIDSDNRLLLSGNFRLSEQISKIAYIGPSKNTYQEFSLHELVIKFIISDDKNNYNEILTLPVASVFILDYKFNIPYNFDISNFKIKSFEIIGNYIYGNNKISSLITINKKILLQNKEDNMINFIQSVLPYKSIKQNQVEHFEDISNDPFFTLYWLIPVSIFICSFVYYFKIIRSNKTKYSDVDTSSSE